MPAWPQGKHTGAWLDFGKQTRSAAQGRHLVCQRRRARAPTSTRKSPAGISTRCTTKARATWTELLDRAKIEGGTPTSAPPATPASITPFLSPNLFSDEDGNYIGFDDKVHSLSGKRQHAQYANFSDWDIYRNTVQLQALFDPERESDMMQSLVNDAVESGWYPRWPAANDVTYVMGGDSPVILLSSSYAFGARNFDVETALKYMVKAGTELGERPARRVGAPLPGRLPQARLRAHREGLHRCLAHAGVCERRFRHRAVRASDRP